MIFVILAVIIVINVSTQARCLRDAVLYGALAGILLGLLSGSVAGYALAQQWHMPRARAILLGAGIETAWKAPLLTVLCALGYALRPGKPHADTTPPA